MCRTREVSVLACAWLLGCAAPPDAGAPLQGAVLVVLDTLRADRLSAYGHSRPTSPAIDALAADGVLFEAAIASAPRTLESVAALLSGSHPARAIPGRTLRASLVEALAEAGVATGAVTEGAFVSRFYAMDRGFQSFEAEEGTVSTLPAAPGTAGGIEGTFERARSWLADHADQRFFLLVHSYETHTPYRRREFSRGFGRGRFGPTFEIDDAARVKSGEIALGPVDLEHVGALYDGGVAEADRQVGGLLAQLDALGLSDRTLVVVTSDHGEGLGERFPGWAGSHGHVLYDALIRVPLVLRDPARRGPGRRVPFQVRLLDVMPTVLERLGVPVPAGIDGRSLVPLLEGRERGDREALASQRPRRGGGRHALRAGRFKLIVSEPSARPETPAVELYDLRADPAERNDLSAARPRRVERMRARLERAVAAAGSHADEAGTGDLPAPLRERLESLGYLD